jgi:two-component system response regulator
MMEAKARLSIMLVEDDPAHAEITLRSIEELAPERCDIEHVVDGQAALDRLRSARAHLPDLVLLDLRLPRLDGLELLALVQGDAALNQIPMVVLTTSDADADRQRALACGASSYLVKPFGEHELLEVTQMLGCQGVCIQRAPRA